MNLMYCLSKGKEHKRYEFGAKASIALTKNSGIIVGALSFAKNIYAGHTPDAVFEQIEKLCGKAHDVAICDRGYRRKSKIGKTQIVTPKPPGKRVTAYQKQKTRQRFRRRAGIEPIISYLKYDHRLNRNFLKGIVVDNINLMLAAAAPIFFILFWDGVFSANLKNLLYATRRFDYSR